ncbi:hypothetical protein WMY93_017097 [Mugilogobius chulae]|uniref:Uncharacterized protein n=1 Tax=Mugilogobius chulae TaxID=88201 RepID=A0AAW0NS27_9GOBI
MGSTTAAVPCLSPQVLELSARWTTALCPRTCPCVPKEKKSKGMFSLKLKKKKNKPRAEDVFFVDPGDPDSISQQHMSYDQMSISTECSYRPEPDWDPQSENTSMISFDMSSPQSPKSPSKYFKNSEDKKGVLDRISNFFNHKKRKSSNSKLPSEASTEAGSPLSPRSLQFRDDGLLTLTQSPNARKKGAECSDNLSNTSTPSTVSLASVVAGNTELPFADSSSSGKSSVREVTVCKISTAEGNSLNVTSSTCKTSSLPKAGSSSVLGFADSVVEEVSKRLQVLEHTEENKGERTFQRLTQTTVTSTSSNHSAPPKSPNLTSISLATKKSSVKVGENEHSTSLSGITLGSQSSTSHLITKRQDQAHVPTDRCNDVKQVETVSRDLEEPAAVIASHQEDEAAKTESPVLVKAIWVETHLGEEGWSREGETDDLIRGSEEGFRADSPPVLAIPVTVIPEDDSFRQSATDRPATPRESAPSGGSLPEPALTQESHRASPEPGSTSAGTESKPKSITETSPGEVHVTRKTVSLPSKHRFFAHKVNISSGSSSDENKTTEEAQSTSSKAVDSSKAKLPPVSPVKDEVFEESKPDLNISKDSPQLDLKVEAH